MAKKINTKPSAIALFLLNKLGKKYWNGRLTKGHLTSYSSIPNTCEVDGGTKAICDHAFDGVDNVKRVSIDCYLEAIGEYAFSGGIEEFSFKPRGRDDKGLQIKEGAFLNLRNLTRLALPRNTKYIGANAFGPALTELEFDGYEAPEFHPHAFASATSLKHVFAQDSAVKDFKAALTPLGIHNVTSRRRFEQKREQAKQEEERRKHQATKQMATIKVTFGPKTYAWLLDSENNTNPFCFSRFSEDIKIDVKYEDGTTANLESIAVGPTLKEYTRKSFQKQYKWDLSVLPEAEAKAMQKAIDQAKAGESIRLVDTESILNNVVGMRVNKLQYADDKLRSVKDEGLTVTFVFKGMIDDKDFLERKQIKFPAIRTDEYELSRVHRLFDGRSYAEEQTAGIIADMREREEEKARRRKRLFSSEFFDEVADRINDKIDDLDRTEISGLESRGDQDDKFVYFDFLIYNNRALFPLENVIVK